jgi:dihydroorotase-like cyclic amidohydrolase
LLENVNIFDGTSEKLFMGREVLVEGNLIKEIGRNPSAAAGAEVIDGRGLQLRCSNREHLGPGMDDEHTLESFYRIQL